MADQRFLIYRPIHKALRHLLFLTSRQIGLTDFADDSPTQATLANLDRTIGFLREHRRHEETHVHPVLENKVAGITASFVQDHEEDDRLSREIEQLGVRIKTANEVQRVELRVEMHERFNEYIGIYLGHLYREEAELQQALCDNLTDDELIVMGRAIARDVPPKRMAEWLNEMCASYNPDEISLMLNNVKAGAPPEDFQGVLQMAERVIQPAM